MKRTIFSLTATLFLFGLQVGLAQDLTKSQIPGVVGSSFKKQYPDTFVNEWDFSKKKQLYEAEFVREGVKYEAYFSPAGEWVRTQRELKKTDLPDAIYAGLAKTEYADWELDDLNELQTPEHPRIYSVEVEKGAHEVTLDFLPDGKIINKTVKK